MIKNRASVAGALVASALLFSAPTFGQKGGQGTFLASPTAPARFVSVPGQLEFRGVLTARPLQVEDAAKYGLTEAQVLARRDLAFDAMAVYTLVEYVDATDEYLFEVGLGNEQAVAGSLMAGGDFQYIEPDWLCYPIASCTNDNKLNQQWHHNANRMNSCKAWTLETGDPNTVVAVCDTFEDHLDRAVEVVARTGAKPGRYVLHREMLEKEALDAVFIATPDHLHGPIAMVSTAVSPASWTCGSRICQERKSACSSIVRSAATHKFLGFHLKKIRKVRAKSDLKVERHRMLGVIGEIQIFMDSFSH